MFTKKQLTCIYIIVAIGLFGTCIAFVLPTIGIYLDFGIKGICYLISTYLAFRYSEEFIKRTTKSIYKDIYKKIK